jgi:hypothetical protein
MIFKKFKSCFKFVFLTKKFLKRNHCYVLDNFLNAIKNIKIHNIFDIIKILKSMKLNKYTHYKYKENVYLNFFMIFQSSIGVVKSRCDISNGITQRLVCLT